MNAIRPPWALRAARLVRRRPVFNAILIAGSAMIILLLAAFTSRPDGRLHVWFLDVGHTNAVLIQTPGGAHILVDGGRFPSRLLTAIGDRLPFYDRRIDLLVITSPDEWTNGALPAVLARYDAGVIWINGQPNMSAAYAELEAAIAPFDLVTVHAGYTAEFDDGTSLEVLHPQTQPALGERFSEGVVVIRLRYGDVSFLLTSNLSRDAQQVILDADQWPLATVLQLPQHGAARSLSTTFLNAVQPQLVVVQADVANRRDEPHPDVLELLGGVPILRTDEDGTVHLWTDGTELWAVQSR